MKPHTTEDEYFMEWLKDHPGSNWWDFVAYVQAERDQFNWLKGVFGDWQ